jgi:hypothetical protein
MSRIWVPAWISGYRRPCDVARGLRYRAEGVTGVAELERPRRVALSNRRPCRRSPRFVEIFDGQPCLRSLREQRPVEGLSLDETLSEDMHLRGGPLTSMPRHPPGDGHEATRGLREDLRAVLEEDLDGLLSVHAEPRLSNARELLGDLLDDRGHRD